MLAILCIISRIRSIVLLLFFILIICFNWKVSNCQTICFHQTNWHVEFCVWYDSPKSEGWKRARETNKSNANESTCECSKYKQGNVDFFHFHVLARFCRLMLPLWSFGTFPLLIDLVLLLYRAVSKERRNQGKGRRGRMMGQCEWANGINSVLVFVCICVTKNCLSSGTMSKLWADNNRLAFFLGCYSTAIASATEYISTRLAITLLSVKLKMRCSELKWHAHIGRQHPEWTANSWTETIDGLVLFTHWHCSVIHSSKIRLQHSHHWRRHSIVIRCRCVGDPRIFSLHNQPMQG